MAGWAKCCVQTDRRVSSPVSTRRQASPLGSINVRGDPYRPRGTQRRDFGVELRWGEKGTVAKMDAVLPRCRKDVHAAGAT